MFLISSLLVHLFQEDLLLIKTNTFDKQIMSRKEQLSLTKRKVEGLKESGMMDEKRVELLKGLRYETCTEVADTLPIMTGDKEACGALKAAGWKLMAITGGFTIMTERLQKELDLDHVYSNELIFKDGKLDGVKINVDSDKAKSANIKIQEWDEKKEDIVAVVDGANDIKLFDICGLGIAYRAQDIVKDLATTTLEEKDLSKLIDVINIHFKLELPTISQTI